MRFNNFIKSFAVLVGFISLFNCKEKKTEIDSNPIIYQEIKISSKDIEGIKYTEYALSNLSEKQIENWLQFQELNSQIDILKKGDLAFFNDENEIFSTFLNELKEQIPDDIKTSAIKARLTVLETCFYKLEGINDLKNLDKKTILSYIKDVLVAHSNLILQINKKLEQESQNIEKP